MEHALYTLPFARRRLSYPTCPVHCLLIMLLMPWLTITLKSPVWGCTARIGSCGVDRKGQVHQQHCYWVIKFHHQWVNTLRPRQNGRYFADDTFKLIFFNENVAISIKISLKFIPKGPINNIPAMVHIMAWRRSGDKPSSEPVMVSFMTHLCVTRPQWVKCFCVAIIQGMLIFIIMLYIKLRKQ